MSEGAPASEAGAGASLRYVRYLRYFALFLLLFSSIFWIWAIVNTVRDPMPDMGILSFLTVMMSSVYTFSLTRGLNGVDRVPDAGERLRSYGYCAVWGPILTHGLVVANYIVGATMTEHVWNAIYCSIFTVLWAVFMIVHFVLSRKIIKGSNAADAYPQRETVQNERAVGSTAMKDGFRVEEGADGGNQVEELEPQKEGVLS